MLGDNLGSLNAAAGFTGRKELLAVSRELAWRAAARRWRPVWEHLPSELNTLSDALSRLHAPAAAARPVALAGVDELEPPPLESLWKAWLRDAPPRKVRRGVAVQCTPTPG